MHRQKCTYTPGGAAGGGYIHPYIHTTEILAAQNCPNSSTNVVAQQNTCKKHQVFPSQIVTIA